jgi:hypothetical protein
VLLLCWFVERRLGQSSTRWNNVQGLLTAAMVALGLYLALVLTPRIEALQPPLDTKNFVSTQTRRFSSAATQKEFGRAHGLYGALTSVVVLLGVSVLAISAARGVADGRTNEYSN